MYHSRVLKQALLAYGIMVLREGPGAVCCGGWHQWGVRGWGRLACGSSILRGMRRGMRGAAGLLGGSGCVALRATHAAQLPARLLMISTL
jgi:hypothetical protein